MTTLHTLDYYAKNEEKFSGKRGTIDLVKELADKLSVLTQEAFPDEQWLIITQTFAKQVADVATTQLLEEKKLYDKVRANSNCLGYTTKIQETQECYRIVTTFEYNCYKLKQFKKQHNL